MTSDARLQKLLHAYDLERQDERGYWTTTSALMLTALSALLTVTLVAKSPPWGMWIAVPFIAFALGAYHVQQSAIGARRRWYMEALEVELSKGEWALVVDERVETDRKVFEPAEIRPFANNGYTWSLATNDPERAAGVAAICIFVGSVLGPALLIAGAVAVSLFRIVDSGHPCVAWGVGIPVVLLLAALIWTMFTLTTRESRQKSWEKVN
ncbi:hypothetical protein ACQEWB_33445 [Streptomyces sp. CA-249302]|uniref:hypothetical protein n=1 Tax=Streptomyces sp. CA-249302 TaxID=3240058 RepID=UPI003D90E7B1